MKTITHLYDGRRHANPAKRAYQPCQDGKTQCQQTFPGNEQRRMTLTEALAAGPLAHRLAVLQGN